MRRLLAQWRASDPYTNLVLLGAVTAVVFFGRGLPWRGEMAWTLDWVAGTTVLAGPLAAGISAFQSARWGPLNRQLIVVTARRRVVATFYPAVAVLLSALAVYLVVTVAAVGITLTLRPTDGLRPEVWILGILKLAMCVAFGWLLGSRLRAPVAAVVSVVCMYALIVLASGHDTLSFFRVGGSTGSLAGSTIDERYISGAAILFVAVAVLLGGAQLALQSLTKAVSRRTVTAGVVLVLLGLWLTSVHGADSYKVANPMHRRCDGAPVSVCLLVGNTSQLSRWSSAMNEAAAKLTAEGLNFPSRYEQPGPGGTRFPSVGEIFIDDETINTKAPPRRYIVESLSTPATCPGFAADLPPRDALHARFWLSVWMFQELWPDDTSYSDPEVTAWRKATTPAKQTDWAVQAFNRLRACDLGELAAPIAGG